MAFRVSSNIASLTAQRHLGKAERKAEHALVALASGSRVANAGDDAAGFAIAETLRGQLGGLRQAKINAESAQALMQTAEGGLNEQNNILVRMRELAVSAASDTAGEDERGFIDREFQGLIAEFDRIARSTRYGNKALLSGSGEEFQFQLGAYEASENLVSFSLDADTTSKTVGIDGLGVADQDEALSALEDIDESLIKVADARSTFGAMQSRFNFAIDSLMAQAENVDKARSILQDADLADEVSQLAAAQIQLQAGISVLAQANSNHAMLVKLIG